MPFQSILSTLVETWAPVVRAAIFCDDEGERVDAYRLDGLDGLDAWDVDLLGASVAQIASRIPVGAMVRVLHGDRCLWLAAVDGGYYLVLVCRPVVDGAVRDELPRVVAALAAHM